MDEDSVFRAISVEVRRQLLDELAERDGLTLFELTTRMVMKHQVSLSRQALTKHLNVLEKAGLVRSEWEWRSKHHYLERAVLNEVRQWLDGFNEGKQGE